MKKKLSDIDILMKRRSRNMSLASCSLNKVMKSLVIIALLVFLSEHFFFQSSGSGIVDMSGGTKLENFYYCPVREEDAAKGVTVTVERHTGDKQHGDLCRLPNEEWYCPDNCQFVETAPYCSGLNGVACRFAPSQCAAPVGVDDWAKGKTVSVERHTQPDHGDVCRLTTGETFCPRGCTATEKAPFCLSKDGSACRAAKPDADEIAALKAAPPPPPPEPVKIQLAKKSLGIIMAGIEGAPQCASPGGKDEWAVGLPVLLERYDVESTRGDICRVTSGGNFCPQGCTDAPEPSYCNDPDGTPCRIEISSGEDQAAISHPCLDGKVPEWAVGQPVKMERHSTDPEHGDVCRTRDNWYCPKGCRQLNDAPYCSELGSRASCRAEGSPGTKEEQREEKIRMRKMARGQTIVFDEPLRPKAPRSMALSSQIGSGGGGVASVPPPRPIPPPPPRPLSPATRGFGATVDHFVETSTSVSVMCNRDTAPSIAGHQPDRHFDTTNSEYAATYNKLVDNLKQLTGGDITFDELALPTPGNLIVMGSGGAVGTAAWNSTYSIPADRQGVRAGGSLVWADPPSPTTTCTKTVSLDGPLIVVAQWWVGNFFHFTHDTLPIVYWMKRFRAPKNARFGLPDHMLHRQVMNWLDPSFADQIEWIPVDTHVCFTGNNPSASILAARYQSSVDRTAGKKRSDSLISALRNSALFTSMALEVALLKPIDKNKPKHILFVTNSIPGREIPAEHKSYLTNLIRQSMKSRSEELVVYNGLNANSEKLSMQESFDLFRYASVVIGPQGIGLTNLIWLAPSTTGSCANNPKVVELLCTKELKLKVCGVSYWAMLGGAPWIKFHHVLLARNSTDTEIFVEGPELEGSLSVAMAKPRPPARFPRTLDPKRVLGVGRDPLPMLVDTSSTLQSKDIIPFFFHVPKAAGSSLEMILSAKMNYKTLPSGDLEDLGFVERSQALQRHIAQYLKTPLFLESCAFLSRAQLKARAFTVLREPVSRLVSLFHYKKYSTWEKDFDSKFQGLSFASFLTTVENDWLTWSLARAAIPTKSDGSFDAEYEEVFEAARYILLEKMVVGFMDDLDYSCQLFFKAFGWSYTPGDIDRLTANKGEKKGKTQDDISALLPKVQKENDRDIRLYNEARRLYIIKKKQS